jgi:uncharacterized membrane protein YkvA (DUF1232 family)
MPKARVLSFPNPRRVWSFLTNAEESTWKKWMVALAVLYVVCPIDAVPDLVPVWGWLDDLGAVGIALAFLARAVEPYGESTHRPQPVAVRIQR